MGRALRFHTAGEAWPMHREWNHRWSPTLLTCDVSLCQGAAGQRGRLLSGHLDRKSTRLNSSHLVISYAVFCLKKKKFNHSILDSNRHSPIGPKDYLYAAAQDDRLAVAAQFGVTLLDTLCIFIRTSLLGNAPN